MSILTNNSAMVALQTLKSINTNLSMTQGEISTGKSISGAKDNAAVWAISKTMSSDVKGFEAISDSLALGESTVSVASSAAETVTDLLTDIKGKIVAAQEGNVDRAKIQTDISALSQQIEATTKAAQFNGLNLVEGGSDVDILASLDRSGNGAVTTTNIKVTAQDLSQRGGIFGDGADITKATVTGAGVLGAASSSADTTFNTAGLGATPEAVTIAISGINVAVTSDSTETNVELRDKVVTEFNRLKSEGQEEFQNLSMSNLAAGFRLTRDNLGAAVTVVSGSGGVTEAGVAATADQISFADTSVANDSYRVNIGSDNFVFVADGPNGGGDIALNLAGQINNAGITGVVAVADGGILRLGTTNGSTPAFSVDQKVNGTVGGGLSDLKSIDVTNNAGATAALDKIEDLIQDSIEAAADFGSVRGRIETQSDFVSKLTDSFKSGIGALVDADLEETSARLQALQVQQQLATQSLSIANQAPQSILSLFR